MKGYLLIGMTVSITVWGCGATDHGLGAGAGALCQSDSDCAAGLRCDQRGSQGVCFDPQATADAGPVPPVLSPDAGVPPACPSPPTCNWCQGAVKKDVNGCVIGFVCANGADPCVTQPCSETDPRSCPPGQACRAGLCWGGSSSTPVCTPGAASCEDLGHVKICSADGASYDIEECPPYQRCESGSCVSAGTVKGSLRVSVVIANYWPPVSPLSNVLSNSVSASFTHDSSTPAPSQPLPLDTCKVVTTTATSNPPPDPSKDLPFDGGSILVTGLPSGTRNLFYNAQTKTYSLTPALGTELPYGATLTFDGSGVGGPSSGLVSAFTATIKVPQDHQVLQPKPIIVGGTSLEVIPKGQPLTVKWSNPTHKETIRLVLHQDLPNPPNTFNVVTCEVLDDGEFTIPASLLASFPPTVLGPDIPPMANVKLFFTLEVKGSFQAAGLHEGEAVADLHQISGFNIK